MGSVFVILFVTLDQVSPGRTAGFTNGLDRDHMMERIAAIAMTIFTARRGTLWMWYSPGCTAGHTRRRGTVLWPLSATATRFRQQDGRLVLSQLDARQPMPNSAGQRQLSISSFGKTYVPWFRHTVWSTSGCPHCASQTAPEARHTFCGSDAQQP